MSGHKQVAQPADGDTPEVLPRRAIILMPVDPAAISMVAVQPGLSLARQMKGELVLFHAVNLNLTPYGPVNLSELKAALRREAMEKLKPLMYYACATGVPAICAVEDGPQAEAILKAVKKLGVDLIVLDSHPHGFFSRWFHHRLRERVLREANCPVIVVEK